MVDLKKFVPISVMFLTLLAVPTQPADAKKDTQSKHEKHKGKEHKEAGEAKDSLSDPQADEKFLRAQAADYAKAFAAGDAATIANMWTEDGTYTDATGQELRGRSAIQQLFTAGFKQSGLRPLEITVDSIRFPAPDVAIEEGTSRLINGRASGVSTRYVVVHIKKDGVWKMASVTESDGQGPATTGLKDFDWLVGKWTAKGPKGALHIQADWAGTKFIRCRYIPEGGDLKAEEVQVIGWNPIMGRLASWHFDARGGFGYGKWLKDGDNWVETANGIEGDGTVNSGVQVMHRVDNDSFKWRSTGRTLGGRGLPDTDEITVTRDK